MSGIQAGGIGPAAALGVLGNVFEGDLVGTGLRIAVVAARFNSLIVERLIAGCTDTLRRHGVAADAIDLVWVPGAFELPAVAQKLALGQKYHAVIALGAVIRGGTDHYGHVCAAASQGLAKAAQAGGAPVILGVLTCDTVEQALDRAGVKAGNKGSESALAAIEMARLYQSLATGLAAESMVQES